MIEKYADQILGGLIMSISSSLHLLLKGKITGISGTYFKTIKGMEEYYNLCFILGMLTLSSFIQIKSSENIFPNLKEYINGISLFGIAISGFLVGFGTKMGNGCTSGHGVCGLPRLSKRSFCAVSMFMSFGIITAHLKRKFNLFSFDDYDFLSIFTIKNIQYYASIACFSLYVLILLTTLIQKKFNKFLDYIISFLIGASFSYGLIKSGMVHRQNVINFLLVGKNMDISLAFVLASAVCLNLITFNIIIYIIKKPIFNPDLQLPDNTEIDNKLIVGEIIFGIGWGIGGVCPGPAIVGFFNYIPYSLAFLICMTCGQLFESSTDKYWAHLLNKEKILKKKIK